MAMRPNPVYADVEPGQNARHGNVVAVPPCPPVVRRPLTGGPGRYRAVRNTTGTFVRLLIGDRWRGTATPPHIHVCPPFGSRVRRPRRVRRPTASQNAVA